MARHKDMSSTEREKPGFFYGYVIAIAAFAMMMLNFGVSYSFGIFFNPLSAEFGWTRALTSGAYSLSTFISGFLGIFAGKLTDWLGSKIAGTACGFFLGLGFLLMSRVNAVWQVYLVYGLIIAAGVGSCWPIVMPTVARWFSLRRGLITGIVTSGAGLGIITIPQFASWLTYTYDWRLAYGIIGIGAMVLMMLAAQFLKRDPAQIGQVPYGEDKMKQESAASEIRGLDFGEAIRTGQFWIICIIYFCFGFCMHSVMVHIVPHSIDIGISAASAASVLAVIGGLNIVGRIILGIASDRFGVKPSLIFGLVLIVAALLWLQLAGELWMLYVFSIIFGFAYGGVLSFMALVPAELFGLHSIGVIMGTVTCIFTIGGAAGPVISGHIFDITGSYSLAFWVAASMTVISCVLSLLLKPPLRNEQTT